MNNKFSNLFDFIKNVKIVGMLICGAVMSVGILCLRNSKKKKK